MLPRQCSRVRPILFVVNTDRARGPGEHWVCIYLNPTGVGEYFDSYGFPPRHREIKTFLQNNSQRYIYNNLVLQEPFSQTCGYYCVYYAKQKAKGYSLRQILRNFRTLRPYFNDQYVINRA